MVTDINFGSLSTVGGRTTLSGSASGLDTEALIEGLTEAKRLPAVALEEDIEFNNQQISAYGELETILTALNSSLNVLRGADDFDSSNIFDSRQTFLSASDGTSANNYLGVTAEAGATASSYQVEVDQLATEAIYKSNSFTSNTSSVVDASGDTAGMFSAGSFTLNGQTITLEEGDSLVEVASAFNNVSDDTNVEASILQVSSSDFRLILTQKDSGSENKIEIIDELTDFEGVDDYIDVGDNQDIGTSDKSFSFVFNTTSANEQVLINKRANGAGEDGFDVRLNSSGQIEINFGGNDAATYTATSSLSYNNGVDNYVTANIDRDGNFSVYVNGDLAASVDISAEDGVDIQNSLSLKFGAGTDAAGTGTENFFDGTIYNVAAYDRVLTENEIEDFATGTKDIAASDRTAYWQGHGATAADWEDQVGAANGTINGAPPSTNSDPVFPSTSIWSQSDNVGQDAQITLYTSVSDAQNGTNGITVSRSSNSFSDVIDGLTFSLFQATPTGAEDTYITIDVEEDIATVSEAIGSFVDAYNNFRVFVSEQHEKDSDGNYLDTAILRNSSLLDNVTNTLGNFLSLEVSALQNNSIDSGTVSSLSDIGFSFATFEGNETEGIPVTTNILGLDVAQLASKLQTNFDDVRDIFQLSFSSSATNFSLLESNNVPASETLTINVSGGTTAVVTAIDGHDLLSDYSLTFDTNDSRVTGTLNPDTLEIEGAIAGLVAVIKGAAGTPFEGMEILYYGEDDSTADYSVTLNDSEKEYTIDIDHGTNTFAAEDRDGDGDNDTDANGNEIEYIQQNGAASITHIRGLELSTAIEMDYVKSQSGLSATITGEDDSIFGAMGFFYSRTGDGTDTVDFSFKQGIGDILYNATKEFSSSRTSNIIDDEISNINTSSDSLQDSIDRIDRTVESYRDRLFDQFAALEAAIIAAESTLQLIEAQNSARENS